MSDAVKTAAQLLGARGGTQKAKNMTPAQRKRAMEKAGRASALARGKLTPAQYSQWKREHELQKA